MKRARVSATVKPPRITVFAMSVVSRSIRRVFFVDWAPVITQRPTDQQFIPQGGLVSHFLPRHQVRDHWHPCKQGMEWGI
jgi:hypothetical protein